MSKYYLLDSGVIKAIVNKKDQSHVASNKYFNDLVTNRRPIMTLFSVAVESLNTSTLKNGSEIWLKGNHVRALFLNSNCIISEGELYGDAIEKVLPEYYAGENSLTDELILMVAKDTSYQVKEVATTDSLLAKKISYLTTANARHIT